MGSDQFVPAGDKAPDQEKRSCIQEVDGYAYLSEEKTLSQIRSAAFANAKRQAVENARTFIRSKTQQPIRLDDEVGDVLLLVEVGGLDAGQAAGRGAQATEDPGRH